MKRVIHTSYSEWRGPGSPLGKIDVSNVAIKICDATIPSKDISYRETAWWYQNRYMVFPDLLEVVKENGDDELFTQLLYEL